MKKVFAASCAIILCLILYVFTKNILFISLSFLCAGAASLLSAARNLTASRAEALVYGILFLIYGILIMTIPAGNDLFGYRYPGYIISWGLGVLFMTVLVFRVMKLFICRTAIDAAYIGASEHVTGKGVSYYIPRFRYHFQNGSYENISGESLSRRKLQRRFQIGSTYTIYINEKNPCIFITRHRPDSADLLLLVFTIICFLIPSAFS